MAQYSADLSWERGDQDFLDNRYSRRHELRFDGGAVVAASSSPHVVPLPLSDPAGVDPEEAFVASLASCHMLWFLSLAAKAKYRVDSYHDHALGVMGKNPQGRTAMTLVTLHPDVRFRGDRKPSRTELDELHHKAHQSCFIANSVKTVVLCEPVWRA